MPGKANSPAENPLPGMSELLPFLRPFRIKEHPPQSHCAEGAQGAVSGQSSPDPASVSTLLLFPPASATKQGGTNCWQSFGILEFSPTNSLYINQ